MRVRVLLAALLLGVVLCFVPALGYGEVKKWMNESKATYMEFRLLQTRINYIMRNPTVFLEVDFWYGGLFTRPRGLPKDIDTIGKIIVSISDSRNKFSYKSGVVLLDQFKKSLEVIYSFIDDIATDMDTDVVVILYSRQAIPLGYFYQGEYHRKNSPRDIKRLREQKND